MLYFKKQTKKTLKSVKPQIKKKELIIYYL